MDSKFRRGGRIDFWDSRWKSGIRNKKILRKTFRISSAGSTASNPPVGVIGAMVYLVRGSRRMAFQALACGWWTWLGYGVIFLLAHQGRESIWLPCFVLGTWLVMPVATLYFLRTLKRPTPTPLKMGRILSIAEMVIVVAIIGILASIAISAYNDFNRRVRSAEARAAVTSIHDALIQWQADPNLGNGSLPSNVDAKGKDGKSFAAHFPKEAAWLAQGGTNYIYTFAPNSEPGAPPTLQVTARARRPKRVYEPTLVSQPDGTVMGLKK